MVFRPRLVFTNSSNVTLELELARGQTHSLEAQKSLGWEGPEDRWRSGSEVGLARQKEAFGWFRSVSWVPTVGTSSATEDISNSDLKC